MRVTDAGLETDLIFNHGVDLPEFAAFPLLDTDAGRALLRTYFEQYCAIAGAAGAGLLLETPTWRSNPDWGARVGYDVAALSRVNRESVGFLRGVGAASGLPGVAVGGTIGPRGDGYRTGTVVDPDEAAEYHRPQLEAFAAAGADQVGAYTLTGAGEAIGVVRAARASNLPVAISFTVEADGRLPDGVSLADAVATVEAAAPADSYLVNCAHPDHVAPAFAEGGAWLERIHGLRCNASRRSHAELDEAVELDDGDPAQFGRDHDALRAVLPNLSVLGGCCGTDARHVAALWGVPGAL